MIRFIEGGGEMGALMRAYDWSATRLGPPHSWPQSLRVSIRILLNTRHPMFIFWGPDLICFYNDAYRATMGPEKHPSGLGARGRDLWDEIWPIIGPQIDLVMAGKGATWHEDALVPVTRHGSRQDVWWTYGYSPIDDAGDVGGVLVVCNDVTKQHLAAEALKDQTRTLQALFEQAPGFIAVLRGPSHVYELTNAAYRSLVDGRDLIGKTVAEAIPEAGAQGFFALLDEVYTTGRAHVGKRAPLSLSGPDGAPKETFLDFVYQPIFEADGSVSGIFVEGYDVTEEVLAENRLRLVNDELKHRVKNTLAVVGGIATQTLRRTAHDGDLQKFLARLNTFARAHDSLTATTWATASIGDIVQNALAPYRTGQGRFTIAGPALVIDSKQALSLALAVHELATNAVKYGALSTPSGRISVTWERTDAGGTPRLVFVWKESGGPAVEPPSRKGFGSQLITRALAADFGGTVDMSYDPAGVSCRLEARLDRPTHTPF